MKITELFLLTATSISWCNGKQAIRQSFNIPGSDFPQAWIDAPLPEMHIPLAPYEFVAHGTDQDSISQLEWILDGASLGIVDAKNSAQKLATFMYLTSGPGTYTLQVRAKNSANKWSDIDEAVFIIGGTTPTITLIPSDTPTITLIPSDTPTPVVSDTPTLVGSYTPTLTVTTPTETKTPTPIPAGISFTPGLYPQISSTLATASQIKWM